MTITEQCACRTTCSHTDPTSRSLKPPNPRQPSASSSAPWAGLTGLSSMVGLLLVINYGLATQWMSPGQQGFHMLLTLLMITFFFSRAGRTWGLDGRLAESRPKSWMTRRPFS